MPVVERFMRIADQSTLNDRGECWFVTLGGYSPKQLQKIGGTQVDWDRGRPLRRRSYRVLATTDAYQTPKTPRVAIVDFMMLRKLTDSPALEEHLGIGRSTLTTSAYP